MSSAHAFPAAAATAKRSHTSTLLPRFAWAVLAYNVVVILWGAVRARDQLRRRLRRSLAVMQRCGSAKQSAAGNSDRACSSS